MKVIKINNCGDCPYLRLSQAKEEYNEPFCALRSDWGLLTKTFPAIPDDCPLDDHVPDTGKEIADEEILDKAESQYVGSATREAFFDGAKWAIDKINVPDTGKEIDHSGDTNKMILDILIDVQTYELSQTEGIDRINIMIEEAEKKAALAAWMTSRHRYSGVVGGNKPAETAFEKWFDQWKEVVK